MSVLIDFDLDWLNTSRQPVNKLRRILQRIPNDIPVKIAVEHHDILKTVDRWVRERKISYPFSILHVDQHHDFYLNGGNPPLTINSVHCGNWGFRFPTSFYDRFIWVKNDLSRRVSDDWEFSQQWLLSKKKKVTTCETVRSSNTKNIVGAFFCVSPDYMDNEAFLLAPKLVKIVADHFGLKRYPRPLSDDEWYRTANWSKT
jgi:hypothetical protein